MTKLFPRILCSACVLRGACIAAALACIGGCGQKGALYLPDDPAAGGRATLDQVLVPFRSASPSIPTPLTSTLPTQEPPPPTREGATGGGTGTGTASPVERP